jgi:hypothetical protein
MDFDYDLLRSLAILTGASMLLVIMADYSYQTDFIKAMAIVWGASLLIVLIADRVGGRLTTSAVKAKAFVLAIAFCVSLVTVFIASNLRGRPSTSEEEARLLIAVLIGYTLLYVGIKGLVWD